MSSLNSAPALVSPHHSGLNAYHFNNPAPSLTSSSFPGASRLLSRYTPPTPLPHALQNSPEHYGYGVADGMCEPYSFQSPSHSTYDSSSSGAIFGARENLQSWSSTASHAGRSAPNSFDQEPAQLRYPSSALPYIGLGSAPNEGPSAFSGMGSLASSLPPAITPDRMLPTPRTQNVPSANEPFQGANNGYYSEVPSTLAPKSQLSWVSDRTNSVFAPASQSASSTTSGVISTCSIKAPSSEPQEPSFTYHTLQATQPSPTGTATSTSDFAMTPTGASSGALDDHVPGQSFPLSLSSSYNYASNTNKSRSAQPPPALEGTLLSSHQYTALPQRHVSTSTAHAYAGGAKTRC